MKANYNNYSADEIVEFLPVEAESLTMLNSCGAGVGVVNIDNGFGAAILAGQILRMAQNLRLSSEAATGE